MREKVKKEYVLAIIIGILLIYSLVRIKSEKNEELVVENKQDLTDISEDESQLEDVEEDIEETYDIYVHISGAVYNSGIQMLKNGDRVVDAVEAAGGLTTEVDLDKINLSKRLKDEDKIYIPKIGEVLENNEDSIYNEVDMNEDEKKIDINGASKEDLITLPGIGEKTADKILEYRKDKKFEKIEDLKNVSGIGDKKFEAVSGLIIVR